MSRGRGGGGGGGERGRGGGGGGVEGGGGEKHIFSIRNSNFHSLPVWLLFLLGYRFQERLFASERVLQPTNTCTGD